MELHELRKLVLFFATDKDFVPIRDLLTQVGNKLPEMPLNCPLRTWWSEMTLSYLRGEETPSTSTRNANQMFLLAAKPSHKDADDLNLDF